LPWKGLSLAAAVALILLSGLEALALGPFTHLVFAQRVWQRAAPAAGLAAEEPLLPALYAGALAPDAGYYPGAEPMVSEAAHLVEPWDLVRELEGRAGTARERAFALGWLTHALLDLRGHQRLVNPLAGGAYQDDRLLHKQVEWGLDCWLLSQPRHAWLWEPPIAARAGVGLWARTLEAVYGKRLPADTLVRAQAAQLKEVRRLPWVWWLSGRLHWPGRPAANALGWAVGHTLRPAYAAWLEWQGGSLDVRAVLTPRQARPRDTARLLELLAAAEAELMAVLEQGAWPRGSLDADPDCRPGDCPQDREVRAWLSEPGSQGRGPAKIGD
jgi:hypothetical protein